MRHGAVGVALLAAAVYLNSLGNGFVSDDHALIFEHPYTKKIADWPAIFTSGHYAGSGGYRPLVTLSFALNYLVGHDHPLGYHAVNVLLHALNSALVFLLLFAFFDSLGGALIGGALFAVHPIHTEAVAWISGRAELLACAFLLAAWLLYLRSKQREGRSPAVLVAASLGCYFAALLSKENALVFLPLVIAGDLLLDQRKLQGAPVTKAWRWRITRFYLPCIGVTLAYFILRRLLYYQPLLRVPAQIQFVDNPLAHVATTARLFTAIAIQGEYVGLLLWPLKLCGDYSFNAVPVITQLADLRVLLSMAAVLVALVVCLTSFVRRGHVWFAILFYFIAIFPVSNLAVAIGTIKGERLLYLPSIGFCAAVGLASAAVLSREVHWFQINGRARQLIFALVGVIIVAAACRTWARNPVWKNDEIFWGETASDSPNNVKALLISGTDDLKAGRFAAAIPVFHRLLQIEPDSKDAFVDLGLALMQSGRSEEAVSLYQDVITRHPDVASLHVNYALAAANIGRMATAVTEFRRALALDTSNPVLHFDLGLTFSRAGDPRAAETEYRGAIQLKPDYAEAWNALGAVLIKMDRREEARLALKQALKIRPGYREATYNLTLLDLPR